MQVPRACARKRESLRRTTPCKRNPAWPPERSGGDKSTFHVALQRTALVASAWDQRVPQVLRTQKIVAHNTEDINGCKDATHDYTSVLGHPGHRPGRPPQWPTGHSCSGERMVKS